MPSRPDREKAQSKVRSRRKEAAHATKQDFRRLDGWFPQTPGTPVATPPSGVGATAICAPPADNVCDRDRENATVGLFIL